MKKNNLIHRLGLFSLFTLLGMWGISRLQPQMVLAAQGCSLNSMYGTVTVDGSVVDNATVTVSDINKNAQALQTLTSNGGLYLIETANFNICASIGDQISVSASVNGFSTSTVIAYSTQAATLLNLSILSASTSTPTQTNTTTPTTTSTPPTTTSTPATTTTTPTQTTTPAITTTTTPSTPTITPPATSNNGGGVWWTPPTFRAPNDGFSVVVESIDSTSNPAQVNLKLNGGAAVRMAISNTSDFNGVNQEPYRTNALHALTSGDGTKTIYVKFFDFAGTASPVVRTSVEIDSTANATVSPTPKEDEDGEVLGIKISRLEALITKLKAGQSSNEVMELQNELKKAGYFPGNWRSTKFYGRLTSAAVKKYLATKKLDKLINTLKFGQRNNLVKQLQTNLKMFNFFPAAHVVTSYYGPITRIGVKKYLALKK